MTPGQERAFDIKAEKFFRSHRELPSGRNFKFDTFRADHTGKKGERPVDKFRNNFDAIFPNAPGAGI